MQGFGVMHFEKRHRGAVGGIQRENNRQDERACHNDVDHARSRDNIYFVRSDDWHTAITQSVRDNGARERKNSVVLIDCVYSASPEFFDGMTRDQVQGYFADCLEWHRQHLGREVVNAVVHMDEKTPHMHVVSVPITDRADGTHGLSADQLIGNKHNMHALQQSFYRDVCRLYGLDEPQTAMPGELKKHKTALQHKIDELQHDVEALEKAHGTASQLQKQISRADEQNAALRASVTAKQGEFGDLVADLNRQRDAVEKARKRLDETKAEADKLERAADAADEWIDNVKRYVIAVGDAIREDMHAVDDIPRDLWNAYVDYQNTLRDISKDYDLDLDEEYLQ